jgi:DNA-directed RNA polymerase specialized sigma subunit
MTAKEYLSQARILDKLIDADIHELERLRALSTSLGTQDYSQDRVQTSGTGDKLCEIVAKIVDLQVKINKEIDQYVKLKEQIKEKISSLNNTDYKLLLQMRYINGEKWEQIALNMEYSYRHTTRLHGEALIAIKDVLKCP